MIHKLLKRPQAIIGLCLIAIVIVIAIAAPAFSPHDPELVNLSQKYAQPDAECRAARRSAFRAFPLFCRGKAQKKSLTAQQNCCL